MYRLVSRQRRENTLTTLTERIHCEELVKQVCGDLRMCGRGIERSGTVIAGNGYHASGWGDKGRRLGLSKSRSWRRRRRDPDF